MGKIGADTTRSLLKCPCAHRASRIGAGSSRVPAFRPRALRPPPQAPCPQPRPQPRACSEAVPRPPPSSPHASALRRAASPARGHLELGDRSRHARGPPAPSSPHEFPKFLRAEPGPAWGLSAQEPAGAPPPAGERGGGCSRCPPVHSQRGLLQRKTPRFQSL